MSIAPTTLPFDLDIFAPSFSTMPCVKSRCDRLAMVHQAQVAHHFAEKSRIEQVQNRVLDAADVLVDRKPVRGFLFVEWRVVVVRIGVAIEIPGRVDERVHRVRFAPRRAAALRARGVHKFRQRSASGDCPCPVSVTFSGKRTGS